jgi:hypothetical protein
MAQPTDCCLADLGKSISIKIFLLFGKPIQKHQNRRGWESEVKIGGRGILIL